MPGGVQAQVLGLAHTLRARGIDARVIGPCDGPPPEPGIYSIGPSQVIDGNGSQAPITFGPEVTRRTLQLVKDLDPDVVHLHEPFVPGPTAAILLGSTLPTVGTFHASGDIPWYRRARRFATAAANQLDLVTVVSASAAEQIGGFFEGTVTVVPNGIEVGPIRAAEPLPFDRPVIAFVGRHEERKGLGTLLQAFVAMQQQAVLWVVGTGPETESLRAKNIPNVRWFGTVDDHTRNQVLRSATVFAAPALGGESFGIVLVEAMAAGAAVLASDIGGYRDVVEDGISGKLVPPKTPAAWAQALDELIANAELRTRLSLGGAARAAQFSLEAVTNTYVECYEQSIVTRTARSNLSPARGPKL